MTKLAPHNKDSVGKNLRASDRAVELCWKGKRRIVWKEILAGEKAFNQKGDWLPQETIEAFQVHRVGIKGPHLNGG